MSTKKIIASALLAGVFSANAFALSTTDLGVGGSITPASCVPTLSNAGVVDLGDIYASELSRVNAYTQIAFEEFTISIMCAGPTMVGMVAQDNRVGTAPGFTPLQHYGGTSMTPFNTVFGLGHSSAGKNIGQYSLLSKPASFSDESGAVDVIVRGAAGVWNLVVSGHWNSDKTLTHSFAVPGDLTPKSVTSVSGTLAVSAVVTNRDGLTYEDEITLDGAATIELVYL